MNEIITPEDAARASEHAHILEEGSRKGADYFDANATKAAATIIEHTSDSGNDDSLSPADQRAKDNAWTSLRNNAALAYTTRATQERNAQLGVKLSEEHGDKLYDAAVAGAQLAGVALNLPENSPEDSPEATKVS